MINQIGSRQGRAADFWVGQYSSSHFDQLGFEIGVGQILILGQFSHAQRKLPQLGVRIRIGGCGFARGIVGHLANPAAQHQEQLVRGRTQGIAQKTGDFQTSASRCYALAGRWRPVGAAPGIVADGRVIHGGGPMVGNAHGAQVVHLVKKLGDLDRGLFQRCRPQPGLQRGAICSLGVQGRIPLLKLLLAIRMLNCLEQLRFMVLERSGNQAFEFTGRNLQDAVVIEPALRFRKKRGVVRATIERFAQPAHHVAPLVFRHLLEAQRPIGQLLVLGQRAHAVNVEGPQRAHLWRLNAELGAKVAPQHFRDSVHRVQGAPAHGDEPHVQGQADPVQRFAQRTDDRQFGGAVREKGREFEVVQGCRDVTQSQEGCSPMFHRNPCFGL